VTELSSVEVILSSPVRPGLGSGRPFAGDIHEIGQAAVGGPFDLAYTRFS